MNIGNDSGSGGEVDLNLAPILDCLTVLVAFLLASASFLSLTALESGVAAQSEQAPASDEPTIALYVKVNAQGAYSAHWEKESEMKLSTLDAVAQVLSQKNQKNKLLILAVDSALPVQKVVETLDHWRRLKTGAPITLATE